jgi:GT2 family glycosyltransferase
MDVSIIIVNWNTKAILRDCLDSIYRQTKKLSFEVIVVDNASSDGSGEMVKKEFLNAALIENSKNHGFAAANNQGIALARGRYILLLNSDTAILDGAIEKAVSFADAHLEAAVVGCRVLNPNMTLQPTCFMFPSILNMLLSCSYLYKLFPKSKFFGRERMTWWDRDDVREVEVVTGCFMLVRQEAIQQVGIMDEQFFMYGEETDWCYRFMQAGWKNMFTPNAQIIHLGGQSTEQVKKAMTIQKRKSVLQFIKKHNSTHAYRSACVLTILFFAVRLPVWLVIGLFKTGRRSEAVTMIQAYLGGIKTVLAG